MTLEQIDEIEKFIDFEYEVSQKVISKTKTFLRHLPLEIREFIFPGFSTTKDGGIWGGTLNEGYPHCPETFFTMNRREFRVMGLGYDEFGSRYLIMEGDHKQEDFATIYSLMVKRVYDLYNKEIFEEICL